MRTTVVWLPRADEHDLARSLHLVDGSPSDLRERIDALTCDLAETHPQTEVVVRRWHVWRVVRELARLGAVSDPEGRALVYASLEAGTPE